MVQNDPISALLPKPPLPRPDRREAAIDEAVRRFDGASAGPSSIGRSSRKKRTWLTGRWGRPQLGAMLASALVGLIALPLWISRDRHPELANPSPPLREVAMAGPSSPVRRDVPVDATHDDARPAAVLAEPAEQAVLESRSNKVVPAPEEVGSAVADSSGQEIVTHARRAEAEAPPALALAPPPPAPAAPAMGRAAASESDDVLVTARRAESTSNWKASARSPRLRARQTTLPGDWNACTVNDPRRRLGGCGELASGHVANGLSRAWRGDLDGAIAEFDRAIAASEQPGLAHLNRGLAYERQGQHDRALTDLDRAVRQTPSSARAYYNRSLALHRKGARERAAADADRAIELDPRYRAVIR